MTKLPHVTWPQLRELLISHGQFPQTVREAAQVAQAAHSGQKRDRGTDYLTEHIYPIVDNLIAQNSHSSNIEDMIVLGLLHDSVEDNDGFTISQISKQFGEPTGKRLTYLTKPAKVPNKDYSQQDRFERNRRYFQKIHKADKVTKIVKVEDRINNMQCIVSLIKPKKYARYVKEAKQLLLPIAVELGGDYPDRVKAQIERIDQLLTN